MPIFAQWRRYLEDFLRRHSGPMMLLSALFVIGVIFGALAVRSVEPKDRLEIASYLGVLQRLTNPPEGMGWTLFRRELWGNLKLLALLWVLGISVVGALGVMVVALVQGVISGFVVGFLAAELGGKGILLAMAGHLPPRLLEVPALLLAGTASVAFSSQVVRSWRAKRRVPNFYPALASFTGTLLVMGLVLVAASLVEAYLSPAFLRIVLSLVNGA